MLFGEKIRSELLCTGVVCNICTATIPERSLKIIHTDGLRRAPQKVNAGSEKYSHIELMFCLPDYWDFSVQHWPKMWLEKIAFIPSTFNTWLGPGDTIPAGKPATALTVKFEANHFILAEPMVLSDFLAAEGNKQDDTVVLSVIPIFQQELDFKLLNSGRALLRRLEEKGVTDEVDLYRKSVCRKKILGF